MPPSPAAPEVTVVGGGPAGACLAALLASWGRSVALVDRPPSRRAVPEETVVPGARGLFARLGVDRVLAKIDASPVGRHGSLWGNDAIRWRPAEPDGPGYQVDRARFDRALVERARERGVRVVGDSSELETVGHVVLATGRSAGGHRAIEDELPPTVALSTRVPAGAHGDETLIEAVREGWLWWLPLHSGGACLSLFADRDELVERGRDELWSSALGSARGPAREHAAATPAAGTDATSRLVRSDTEWLVGDAVSALDPLSSQGLEKAVASAEDAAYALNTVLERPEIEAALRDERARWEARLFAAHRTRTLAFYASETRFTDAPFWVRRRPEAAAEVTVPPLPTRMQRNPALQPAVAWRRERRRLVESPAVRLPGDDVVHDRIEGIAVTLLLEQLTTPRSLHELVRAARSRPEFLSLSETALQRLLERLFALDLIVGAPS